MRKPSLLIIFLTVFIDLIGFGIVLPLLPKYAESYGAKGLLIGLIIGSYSLMQFVFAPLWGRLSDRIGRRPVILISTAGSVVAYGLFGVSAAFTGSVGLWVLLGSRLFAGLCGANLSVASAYIADITTTESRSKGMGMIGMAFGLGFILGPVIGAVSYVMFGLQGPGWVAAAICMTNFVLASVLLTESRPADGPSKVQRTRWEQWKHAFARPQLRLLMALFFLANFCFISFEVTLPLLLASPSIKADELSRVELLTAGFRQPDNAGQRIVATRFSELQLELDFRDSDPSVRAWRDALNDFIQKATLHQEPDAMLDAEHPEVPQLLREVEQNGVSPRYNRLVLEKAFPDSIASQQYYFGASSVYYLFAFCGLVAALVQGGLIGRLVKTFGEPRLVWSSLLVVTVGMVMIPFVSGLVLLLLALALFSGGSGVNRAPTMGMISKNADADEQGAILGVAQSVGTVARIVGPVFAATAFAFQPVLPYLICGAVAVVASMIAWSRLRSVS